MSRSSVLLTALIILNQRLFVLCYVINAHEDVEPTNEDRLQKWQSDFMALEDLKKTMLTTPADITTIEAIEDVTVVTDSYVDYELLETTTEETGLVNRFSFDVPTFKCPPCTQKMSQVGRCRKLKKRGCPV